MEFDASFFKEEMRSNFLVTEKRKKIWATELRILEKFDEVCKKYNLTYFAYYGTLLGAVRHQGFIPWDDDVDIAMFRDEYEKFQAVAPGEFAEPYFFQNAYTDRLVWGFSKVRDSRTSAIEITNMPDLNQGIYIDIFPLDDIPNDENDKFYMVKELQKVLWCLITDPEPVISSMRKGKMVLLDEQFIMDFVQKNIVERFRIFEEFNLAQFGKTERINYLISEIRGDSHGPKREWFRDVVYLPFENMRIPAPVDYDKLLTHEYGDYHQFVMGGSSHEDIFLDPDTPYKLYFEKRKS